MSPYHTLRSGFMLLSLAALAWSAQLRHATVTAPPQLHRRQDVCVDATDTPCPDGVGCCPSTAPCTYSLNTPICGGSCNALSVLCDNLNLCCDSGSTCAAISPWLCSATGAGSFPTNTVAATSAMITTSLAVESIYYTVITWTYYIYWYVELYVSIDIVNTENSFSLASSPTAATTSTFVQATDTDAAQSSVQLLSLSLAASAASAASQMPVPTSATYLVAGSSTLPYTSPTATSTTTGTVRTATSTSVLTVSTSEGVRRVEALLTWVLGLLLAGLGL